MQTGELHPPKSQLTTAFPSSRRASSRSSPTPQVGWASSLSTGRSPAEPADLRYYGESVPVKSFSTDDLRFLNNADSLEDSANVGHS